MRGGDGLEKFLKTNNRDERLFGSLEYYNITHDTPDLALKSVYLNVNPANVCLFKVSNYNMFEICSQLSIKTLEKFH